MGNVNGYLPLSFWSWNGDMNKERIEDQIYQLYTQKYSGFFIHARAGLKIPYMGKEWFTACTTAISEAEKLGLCVWLYDEDGWPSGFCGGAVCKLGEDYQAKQLEFSTENKSNTNLIAVYRRKEGQYYRIPNDKAKKGDLFCHYVIIPEYVDLLNPDVTKAFINFTHEQYAFYFGDKFGKVIKGIFTDEPQLVGNAPYSKCIEEEYKKRYGEDFSEHLWLLYVDGQDYQMYRARYWEIVSDLFANNYTKQIADWCEKHHLELTGHFGCEDGMCDQVRSNGDLLTHYSKMQRPGIDYLGRRLTSPVLLKQVSDAAEICGSPMVMSESFGCCGWDVSFPQLCWIADWQSSFGVNSLVTHLTAFSIEGRRKRDYPAFYSDHEPWWRRFHLVNEHIAFVNQTLSMGKKENDILLLQPLNGMWCELAVEREPTDKAKNISCQYRMAIEILTDLQVNYTVVNDDLLNFFKQNGGEFLLKEQSYKTVIVCETISLRAETWEKLRHFAEAGGRLIFINKVPELLDGMKNTNFEKRLHNTPYQTICNRRGLWEKYFMHIGYRRQIEVLSGNGNHIADGIVVNTKRVDNGYNVFIFNTSEDKENNLWLHTDFTATIQVLNDNGETEFLPVEYTVDKSTFCPLKLYSMEGKLIHIIENEVNDCKVSVLKSTQNLSNWNVIINSPNVLVIDKCDIFIDGKIYFSNVYPIQKMDELYKTVFLMQKNVLVTAKYTFISQIESVKPNVSLAVESRHMESVCVNGEDIKDKVTGTWLDQSILKYDISEIIDNGVNTVEISFNVERMHNLSFAEGKYETEINRFIYEVELESIYILGNFDVCPITTPNKSMNLHIVPNSNNYKTSIPFVLRNETAKHYGDLTIQGLWFYRGTATYETTFVGRVCEKIVLSVDGMSGTTADIFINDSPAGNLYRSPQEVNITDYTVEGENTVKIVLFGTNRNLLGPHHHRKGNLNFVGPGSYSGKKDWEEFVNADIVKKNTGTDQYSFIPFEIGNVYLKFYY